MINIIPDILRAVITDIMLVLLIYTMSIPRYKKKWVYITVTTLLVVINLLVCMKAYRTQDYTHVVMVDLVMLIFIAIVLKPLFLDRLQQWCFSYITVLNVYAAVVFLSYLFCGLFPRPIYGNALLRGVFFGIVVFVFWRYAGPLYRKVKEYWHVFSLLTVALFINYLYYFTTDNIETAIAQNYKAILLLILLSIFIYMGIFLSLRVISQHYAVCEENIKMQNDKELLCLSASSMAERLQLMEEASHKSSIVAHDQRHFNNMLLELIQHGGTEDAITFLRRQVKAVPKQNKRCCENNVVDAVVSYYSNRAKQKDIRVDTCLDIPNELATDALELAMVISNLLENAIHGCEALKEDREKTICFTAHDVGRLMLEITNPCSPDTALDEKGYPKAQEDGHGIGTKSVLAFAAKNDAELLYHIEEGVFRVRILVG